MPCPPTNPLIARPVTVLSRGQVIVEVHPSAQLFNLRSGAEALRLGTLDFAWTDFGTLGNWRPEFGFISEEVGEPAVEAFHELLSRHRGSVRVPETRCQHVLDGPFLAIGQLDLDAFLGRFVAHAWSLATC